jgi:parallel beta-helix repeat protein
MKNSLILRSGLVALVLIAAIPAVLGATTITGPTVISSPGTYVLAKDITGGKSPAITVQSSGVTLDGNGHTIRGKDASGSFGILVNKGGKTLTDVTIKNVRLQDWQDGLYFKGVNNGRIESVTSTSNTRAGISLRESNNNVITGCTVSGNSQGMYVWSKCSGNLIQSCTMSNNKEMGLWLASTGRTSSGIVYDSKGNRVIGNTATGNGRMGLYVDFTTGNTLSGNTVTNNDDHGIFLDYSSGNTVTNNRVTSHDQSGMVLFDSDRCTISGNTASQNGDYGLWAIQSQKLSLGSNQLSGNSKGTMTLSDGSSKA